MGEKLSSTLATQRRVEEAQRQSMTWPKGCPPSASKRGQQSVFDHNGFMNAEISRASGGRYFLGLYIDYIGKKAVAQGEDGVTISYHLTDYCTKGENV